MALDRLIVIIVMALLIGALVSFMGSHARGWHFLPGFIFASVFVLGIGLFANLAVEQFTKWLRKPPD